MYQSGEFLAEHPHPAVDAPPLQLLIDALASSDLPKRRDALRALVRRGAVAVPSLSDLLGSRHEHVRWEAAKALGRIGGARAAEALSGALDDESLDVRWTAADGLIAIGHASLVPVLQSLIEHSDSVRVREATAHVLCSLVDDQHAEALSPVLATLRSGVPVERTLVAAHEALGRLRKG